MTEDQGQFEDNEFLGHSLKKFEEMRRRKTKYFFDVDTLLNLIDHYLEILDLRWLKAEFETNHHHLIVGSRTPDMECRCEPVW